MVTHEIKNGRLAQKYLDILERDKIIPDHNKKLIRAFFNEKVAVGLKPDGLYYYLKILLRIARVFNKPLEKITKEELIDFFVNLKPEPVVFKTKHGEFKRNIVDYGEKTLLLYKTSTKTFWNWMFKGKKTVRDEKGFPIAVSWIKM